MVKYHMLENCTMSGYRAITMSSICKTCMVKEPSHVKQLSLDHVCKIGLKFFIKITVRGCQPESCFCIMTSTVVVAIRRKLG